MFVPNANNYHIIKWHCADEYIYAYGNCWANSSDPKQIHHCHCYDDKRDKCVMIYGFLLHTKLLLVLLEFIIGWSNCDCIDNFLARRSFTLIIYYLKSKNRLFSYLNTGFGQFDFACNFLTHENVWISSFTK